jgi:hypothetical protein
MQGDFTLTVNQVLKILVGQIGLSGQQAGGSGGSFVTDNSNNPLIIAGGGGGANYITSLSYGIANMQATTSTTGMSGANANASITAGIGGSAGGGGSISPTYSINVASGGGGLLGNGQSGNPGTGGMAFVNGGDGGAGATSTAGIGGDGGFGGGGGGDWSGWLGSGGGGGYSGGGGGAYFGCGGGGGSFNAGASQSNTAAFNAGAGYVVFTKIAGVNIIQTASVACHGQLSAALTASAYGGQAPYSYTWTPSVGSSSTVSGLGAGTYTCRVADANAVIYTNTFTITQPPQLNLTVTSQNSVSCNGGSNGSITVSTSGGTPTYFYSWSPNSAISPTVTGLSSGTYSCTVIDANGCSASVSVAIQQPSPLTVIGIASNPTLCSGTSCILVGAGANTYTWSGGVTNGVAFTPSITTNYTVTGMNAVGCTATAVTAVVVNASPTITIAGSSSVCAGDAVTLTASGASSYTWSNASNATSISFTPSSTGTYSVIGSNANGCQNTAVKTVSVINLTVVNANASSTAVCIGNPLTLFGSGAATYTWTGGITNNLSFTPSVSSSYTVTGTGACGIASATIGITVNSLPTVTVNASSTVICLGNSVVLNGSGAQTYNWSNGVTNNLAFSPTITTSYAVIGTDANGCQNSASKTISVNTLPLITANTTNSLLCLGNSSTLFGGGALSYTWSGGITDNVAFTPGSTASYTVTGTDANGCQNSAVRTITVIGLPSVIANSSTNVVCSGNSVTLFGSGATTYTWSNGVTNNSAFTPSTTLTYTVSGSNACFTNTSAITVSVNTLPNIQANATNSVICFGNTTTLFGSGGTTYTWTGGITNNVPFSPASSSSYTLTGTGSNGCQNTAARSITVNSLPTLTISGNNPICNGAATSLSVNGASSYTWNTGSNATNISLNPTITTTYSVIGINTNSCVNTSSLSITVNPLPTLTIAGTNTICNGSVASLTISGATTYTWSNGMNGSNISVSPSVTTSYSANGTNSFGCTSSIPPILIVNVNPLPTVTVNSGTICSGASFTINPNGANTYTYTGGSNIVSPLTNTSYTVIGTNTLTGCTSTNLAISSITVLAPPTIAVNNGTICMGQSFTLSPVMNLPNIANSYSYSSGSPVVNPSNNTTYTVTGISTLGCVSLPTIVSVVVNTVPVISVNNGAICYGQSFTLVPSGANTYTISGGSSVVSPSITSTYSITGTNTQGCYGNPAISNLTVNPLPVILLSTSNNKLCLGETVLINASGATSFSWSNGSTNTSITATPSTTTIYSVTGTDLNGCVKEQYITIEVSECTGIPNFSKIEFFELYPNPNNGNFYLKSSVELNVKILNELGQEVRVLSLNSSNSHECSVTDLSKGIYYLIGNFKGEILTKKFVVIE